MDVPERRLARRALLGGAALAPLGAGAARGAPEEPRRGGVLRLAVAGGSPGDSMDPTTWTNSVCLVIGFAVWNALVEIGADNRPVPELAESWEAKPGAAEWVFNLRKGIRFGNGHEFDADDAIYSLNLHRGASKSNAAGPMKAINDIRKTDSHQIAITLATPDAELPALLGDYHLMMVPNGYKDWSRPIGTGGFSLTAFEPGVRAALRRKSDYWKPGRANVDAVELTVINDQTALLRALLYGKADVIHRVRPDSVPQIRTNSKLQLVQSPGGWHAVLAMMVDREPYANAELRLALKYAINREAVLKGVFGGFGAIGNDHPVPKGDPFHNAALAQTPYDPDKARFHFAKAGVADPKLVLEASEAAFEGAETLADLYQASAKKAGIAIEARREPAAGYWDKVWLKADFSTSFWGGRPSATQMLAAAYKSDAAWNETHWQMPAFDKLLADARAELEVAKRRQHIWAMQDMLHAQGGAVIPVFRDWLDAHSVKVGGHTPHSGYDLCNGRICEKAWIKA